MTRIGRKLFYEIETGNIIQVTEERQGAVVATTIEQDIATYTALSERNRETFDVLELPFGAYAQDFAEGMQIIGVDIETKTPIFEYPNVSDPNEPIVTVVPLSEEINALKKENTLLKAQNHALSDRTDFHEEVLTEIILVINS